MDTLEMLGWIFVVGVCVCSILAPLLLVLFELSFLERASAGDGAEGGDSDGE